MHCEPAILVAGPQCCFLGGETDCHVASLLAMTGFDGAVRDERRGEGSESSAAGGRRSEMSEWPRSKFQTFAVRQRRNFGHRNRITLPYGGTTGGAAHAGRRGRRPLRKHYRECGMVIIAKRNGRVLWEK